MECQLIELQSTTTEPLLDASFIIRCCRTCRHHIPDYGGSCRMILWGPRHPDLARRTTHVPMAISYSLKVHPDFHCALWRPD